MIRDILITIICIILLYGYYRLTKLLMHSYQYISFITTPIVINIKIIIEFLKEQILRFIFFIRKYFSDKKYIVYSESEEFIYIEYSNEKLLGS